MLDYPYKVKRGDNLTRIGKRFGYSNPGPIYYYPANEKLFRLRKRKGNYLLPGDELSIPWHPDHLEKLIATSNHLIREATKTANALIRETVNDKRKIDEFLKQIDAINFLAGLGVGIGGLVAKGAKGGTMTSKEALEWLVHDRIQLGTELTTTFIIDSPQAPKKDYRYYIRHAFGPWNPSYWASVYAAVRTGDLDVYLYGTDAIAFKNAKKISQQAKKDIEKLRVKINKYQNQKSMPFYGKRIQ